jgi:hypothetical protein
MEVPPVMDIPSESSANEVVEGVPLLRVDVRSKVDDEPDVFCVVSV